MSPEEKEGSMDMLFTNVTCVSKKDPSNPRNVITFTAFCNDHELACSLLEMVINKADDRGDHQIGSLMRWHLCRMILLGGKGKSFKVAEVLKLVKEARSALEQAASWGAGNHMTPAKEPDTYWPCLGFAARCKAAIKADPSYAQSMVDAFESREVLDREKRHVMCAQCEKLCDKLQKCSACQVVGYCSRSCQVKHWKAGRKQACSEQKAV
ncbi:hypothetical protein COCOBI_15-4370 [Coccomyxa sp. Obi]|nr:hypothetical protein COCOBI_15-4370 [Coccomyxa sp. Obi]